MASNLLQIASQFTNDAIATTPSPCERCSTIIQPGEKCLYVAPLNLDKPGRFVCDPCMNHYLKKLSTTARVVPTAVTSDSGGPNPRASISGAAVNVSTIRAMINESQRRGSHTPQGQVTAVPQQLTSALPLPSVNNPLYFQQYFQPTTSSLPSASGYSPAHPQYQEERKRWAASAYKAPSPSYGQIPLRAQPQNKVPLLLQVSYELLSGKKIEKTGIKEGMPIDYEIRLHDLVDWIKVTLSPLIDKLAVGFAWDLSKMVVREAANWQNVLNMDHSKPYFLGQFLKAKPGSKKLDGSLAFSPLKNPIEFVLIIDREQWLEAEDYNENLRPTYQLVDSQRSVTPDSSLKWKMPPSPEKFCSSTMLTSHPKKKAPHIPPSDSLMHSYKSDSEDWDKSGFKALDPNEIRRGIFLGGCHAIMAQKNQFDLKITERVACFQIKAVRFSELCADSENTVEKNIIDGTEHLGYLTYDKSNLLGKGTFKTAHLVSLKWVSNLSPSSGLGAATSEAIQVALKRPYDDSGSAVKLKRFNYADESRKVVTEGTMLGWADSLLRFAYEFIDNFISNKLPAEPPFYIPQFRFVKAAIAYSEKALSNVSDPSSTSHRAVYLLEELLPADGPFIKYVHNADAIPLQDQDKAGYDMGVFLCFIQHLQFNLTHGQAYISDFQGVGCLLTDPQVMTHPSLIKQENLNNVFFGEGNVNAAFEAFMDQHQCSHYCEWFELDEFPATQDTKGVEN